MVRDPCQRRVRVWLQNLPHLLSPPLQLVAVIRSVHRLGPIGITNSSAHEFLFQDLSLAKPPL